MKRSCEENSRSLENAKRTLILYTEKCSDRLSEISETLIEAKSVLKLSDDVDRLEYGGICPVCSGLVADKADRSAETETARKKADEAEAEKTHLTEILDEYSEKLEKINIRLGELTSRNAASASYIGSLENTKLAKLETLRNLYAECKVSSHSELTDDLEQVIAEIGRTGAYISDVKEVVETEKLAKRAAEEIRTHIAELTGKIIPGEQAELDKLAEDGRRLEKEYEYFEKILGGEAALSKLDAMISVEKKEDELYDRAKKLISEKSELDARLLDIAKDKAVLEYRAYPITKGEKEYSYAALCINLTSEYYNEIIAEIREEEKTKQKIQDEMVAVTRILKDKQTAFNALKEEIDKLQRQLDADNAYMKMLRESESCDARLLEETDFDTVKNEIIDDKAAESLKEEIKAYEADITKYRCEADALNDILSQTKEAYEELDGNAAAEKELAGMLNEREKEYGAVSGTIEFAKKLSDAMSELGIEQAELQKRLSELASGEVGDLIITKINNALNLLLPQYRVKPKNEGLAVLFTDKNGLEKEMPRLEDEEYITLSISIISAAVQIAEEALHTEALLRIVRVQANLVKDETKAKLAEFGQKNNLIIMFHK